MRRKLYRGLNAQVWQERFEAAGWPPLAAEDIAHWLVQDETQKTIPHFANVLLSSEMLRSIPMVVGYSERVRAATESGEALHSP